jgi:phosphatidylglycerophosphate synthase
LLAAQRASFEPAKERLGRFLGVLPFPPAFYTLLGLVLALVAAYTYQDSPLQAALWGTAASLTDFVDGAVARAQNKTSAWGNYLEAIVDRLVELILLLAMSGLGPVTSWAIAACMLISYAKPRAALVTPLDNHDWPGIGDHADRMVILLLSMAAAQFSGSLAQAGLALLTGVALVGALQRLRYAYQIIHRD